jgi:Zn ribbon nucleic-acid-binding protein
MQCPRCRKRLRQVLTASGKVSKSKHHCVNCGYDKRGYTKSERRIMAASKSAAKHI